MQLDVNPNGRTPIYRQIERQIAEAIADRLLLPGERLPTEREVAARLVVSPAAVRKAYERLASDGLCRGTAADGFRVLTAGSPADASRDARRALALVERELLAEELQSAREAQRRLMPPARVESGRWIVEARSRPAGTLSGDFYDVFEIPGDGLGVVVADVAGKGLAAGLLMAVAKSMLVFMTRDRGPGEVLRDLNRRLRPLLGKREFIALACARVSDEGLELANAGMPDPWRIGPDGDVTALSVPGPRLPLGLRERVPYAAARYPEAPGDRLLITTDGIPEARGRDGEPVGYEGLARLIREMPPPAGSAATGRWLDGLLDRVRQRTGPLPEDDWTALLVAGKDGTS